MPLVVYLCREPNARSYHEIAHDESGEEDCHAKISVGAILYSHAVPKRFDPFPAQNSKHHQKCVVKINEIPAKFFEAVSLSVVRVTLLQRVGGVAAEVDGCSSGRPARQSLHVITRVTYRKQLLSHGSEDKHDDAQNCRQVSERTQGRDDDG